MKKWLLLAAVAASFGATRAWAGLDDTPEQCDTAYGKPASIAHTADNFFEGRAYNVHGTDVLVFFYKGKAGQITYRPPVRVTFSDKEIQAMLDDSRGKFTWKPSEATAGPDGSASRRWDRTGGAFASAFSSHGKNSFVVETKLYHNVAQADAQFVDGPVQKPAGSLEGR